jgi:hypothetical protein
MPFLNRLPGSRRAPSGLEWKVLKQLPIVWAGAMAPPLMILLMLHAGLIEGAAKHLLAARYALLGWLLFCTLAALTLAIACTIVVLMKGHAYVADAYPLPDSERPGH